MLPRLYFFVCMFWYTEVDELSLGIPCRSGAAAASGAMNGEAASPDGKGRGRGSQEACRWRHESGMQPVLDFGWSSQGHHASAPEILMTPPHRLPDLQACIPWPWCSERTPERLGRSVTLRSILTVCYLPSDPALSDLSRPRSEIMKWTLDWCRCHTKYAT